MSTNRPIVQAVDDIQRQIATNVDRLTPVATIYHARLAHEAGVEMPPSIVTIVSDPETNAPLIAADPMIGLDLPHQILSYAEPGAGSASIAFADAGFIARRHDISDVDLLTRYEHVLNDALAATPTHVRRPVAPDRLDPDKGILQLVSDYSFDETIDELKEGGCSATRPRRVLSETPRLRPRGRRSTGGLQ